MIRLSDILHPIRYANSLYQRASTLSNKRIIKGQFNNIRRGQCDQCWCGGELSLFKWHSSYGKCTECGCYVNRRPPLNEEMRYLYSVDLYWNAKKKLKGFLTIDNPLVNDCSDEQLEYWLGLIERYSLSKGCVIEVGCVHGVLLEELNDRGYDCVGVEPDERTAEWTRHNTGLDIRSGLFPYIDLPKCNVFLAFDVIEHSSDPVAFMKRVGQLLNLGWIAIIQTPIDKYNDQPPFREMFDKVFDDLEHLYVFNIESFRRLNEIADLQVIIEEGWNLANEVVVLRKESINHE